MTGTLTPSICVNSGNLWPPLSLQVLARDGQTCPEMRLSPVSRARVAAPFEGSKAMTPWPPRLPHQGTVAHRAVHGSNPQ